MNDAELCARDFAGCLIITTTSDVDAELAGAISALARRPSPPDVVLNLRDGCSMNAAAVAALAELRNALETSGGSLHIALPGDRSRAAIDDGSGLSACVYEELADALEVTMAVRAERSVPRPLWIDPRWR